MAPMLPCLKVFVRAHRRRASAGIDAHTCVRERHSRMKPSARSRPCARMSHLPHDPAVLNEEECRRALALELSARVAGVGAGSVEFNL